VAYVRFASVYGNFQGIRDFIAALALLQSAEIDRTHPSWSHPEEASVITSS
jgi:transcriptional repressor NrdR